MKLCSIKEKLSRRLQSKSGFTLIEMVIAVAMVSIIFTSVATLIPTWYRAYTKTVNVNYARQISGNVIGTVEQRICFANNLEVINDGGVQRLTGKDSSGKFSIPMEGSTNLIDGLVYDEKFFINNDIALSFVMDADKKYCTVTVKVLRQGEEILQKQRTVPLAGKN